MVGFRTCCAFSLLWMFSKAQTQFISGIVRDFTASHPDFATTNSFPCDEGVTTLGATLVTTNSFPNRPSRIAGTCITAFDQPLLPVQTNNGWFSTPYTQQNTVSAYTFGMTASASGTFLFNSTVDFRPLPDTNLDPATPNRLWTIETSLTFTYASTLPSLLFGSTDDLYVFINGALQISIISLAGTHSFKTASLSLASLVNGQSYRMDIFMAHRSSQVPRLLMYLPAKTSCNVDVSMLEEPNLWPFNSITSTVPSTTANAIIGTTPGLSTLSAGLQNAGTTSSSMRLAESTSTTGPGYCSWNPLQRRLGGGFTTTFTFTMSNNAGGQGFAFVINGDSVAARGGSDSNMGYGGLKYAVAVEFDTLDNLNNFEVGDLVGVSSFMTSGNHIAVHTNYAASAVSASPAVGRLPCPTCGSSLTPPALPNLKSGNPINVRISYVPSSSRIGTGVINVFICATPTSCTLYMAASVNDQSMNGNTYGAAPLTNGLAFLGFCSSGTANVDITNWRLWTVPISSLTTNPSPAFSSITNWGAGITATNVQPGSATFSFVAKDVCDFPASIGAASVRIQMTTTAMVPVAASPVWNSFTDAGTGSYSVFIFNTLAQPVFLYVLLNGQNLVGGPYLTKIVPAAVNAPRCSFAETSPSPSPLNVWKAGDVRSIQVTARDQFGNLNPSTASQFFVQFSPCSGTCPPFGPVSQSGSLWNFNVFSTFAIPSNGGSMRVYLVSGSGVNTVNSDVNPSPAVPPNSPVTLTVLPNIINATQCQPSTLPCCQSWNTNANISSQFLVTPFDSFNNAVFNQPINPMNSLKVVLTGQAQINCASDSDCTVPLGNTGSCNVAQSRCNPVIIRSGASNSAGFIRATWTAAVGGSVPVNAYYTISYTVIMAQLYTMAVYACPTECSNTDATTCLPGCNIVPQASLYTPVVNPAAASYLGSYSFNDPVNVAGNYLAGTMATVIIQAADQFKNPRSSANDAGTHFFVRVGDAAGISLFPSGADCSNGLSLSIATISNLRCVYSGLAGKYTVTFTPTVAGNYTILANQFSINGNALVGRGTAFTIVTVIPNVYNAQRSFVQLPNSTNPVTNVVTAGTFGNLTLYSYDVYNNCRTLTNDYLVFTTTMVFIAQTGVTLSIIPMTAQSKIGPCAYLQQYNATIAGTYQVTVKLLGTDIQNSGLNILIVPNVVSALGSSLSSADITLGSVLQQKKTSVSISAQDFWGNKVANAPLTSLSGVNLWVLDTCDRTSTIRDQACSHANILQLALCPATGCSNATCTDGFLTSSNPILCKSERITIFYTSPPSGGNGLAPFSVFAYYACGTALQCNSTSPVLLVGARNYPIVSAADSQTSYAITFTLNNNNPSTGFYRPVNGGGGLFTARAGTQSSFMLVTMSGPLPSAPQVSSTGFFYTADFGINTNTGINIVISLSRQGTGGSLSTYPCNSYNPPFLGTANITQLSDPRCYNNSFLGTFTPTIAGNYIFRIRSSVGLTEEYNNFFAQCSTSSNATCLKVAPGPVNYPKCTVTDLTKTILAGTSGSFLIKLFDVYGNQITFLPPEFTWPQVVYSYSSAMGALSSQEFTAMNTTIRNLQNGQFLVSFSTTVAPNGAGSPQLFISVNDCASLPSDLVGTISSTKCASAKASSLLGTYGQSLQILINPGNPSSRSTISAISQAYAGSVGVNQPTINLVAYDVYNNLIFSPVIQFGVQLENNPVPVVTTTYIGSGQFQLKFVAFISNSLAPLSVNVTFEGQFVQGSTMQLLPADFDSSKSYIESGFGSKFVAGTPVVLRIRVYDLYNNAWFCNPSSQQGEASCWNVRVVPSSKLGSFASISYVSPALVGQTGVFDVTWVPFQACLPGLTPTNLFFQMQLQNRNGIFTTFTPIGLSGNSTSSASYVYPAEAYPANTIVQALPEQLKRFPAGTNQNITLTLRDFYLNNLVSSTSSLCGGTDGPDDRNYLNLYYLLGAPAPCLTSTTANLSASVSSSFTGVNTDLCNGKWSITIQTNVAASYSLWIMMGNNRQASGGLPTPVYPLFSGGATTSFNTTPAQPLQICQNVLPNGNIVSGISTQFTVTPLAAFGPNSLLTNGVLVPCASAASSPACAQGSPTYGAVAGTLTSFDIILRDIYYNFALAETVVVNVGTLPQQTNPCSGTALIVSSSNITDLGSGAYRIPFVSTMAQTYNLLVYISGQKVGLPSVCETFVVVPAWVFYFSVCPNNPTSAINLPNDLFSGGRCELDASNPLFGGVVNNNPMSWAIQQTNIVAGIPNSFSVNSADMYGNQVSTAASAHYFVATFTLVGVIVNRAVVSYSFTVNSVLQNGVHVVNYQLAWAGQYTVQVQLVADPSSASQPVYKDTRAYFFTIRAAPSTCLATDGVSGFRCPDNSCQTSYANCPNTPVLCTSGASLKCVATGNCASSCNSQNCLTNSASHCDNDGQCAFSGACPLVSSSGGCPLSAPFTCATTGQCVATSAECRSPLACPYPLFMCDDMRSCVSQSVDCPAVKACNLAMPYLCPGNICAKSKFDCPTPVTCLTSHNGTSAPNQVVCSDGSCQSDPSLCPNQYKCYNNMLRCPDGSCRMSLEDCPTEVTCNPGMIRCEDGSCKSSLGKCNAPQYCPLNTIRCPEGNCVPNVMLCGSRPTCPSSLIKCPDGSCKMSSWMCSAPPQCTGGNSSYNCPGGSCAASYDKCPTIVTCPAATPVRCANGECAASASACSMQQDCPSWAPFHCADNSCAGSLSNCPTLTSCPANAPVRCPDRRCVAAVSMCISATAIACPAARPVRCPSGDCAVTFGSCSTAVSCPSGETRCQDGSCRFSCSGPANHNGNILQDCFPGQVWCPQSGQGTFCANSFAQCPAQLTCPPEKPVRCSDAQCQASVSECADPAPSLSTASNYYACMGGSWAQQPYLCPTSTVCTGTFSVKCWDETCRASVSDCPPSPGCPPSAPFLCPSGSCNTDIYQCTMGVRCNPVSSTPIKCPVYASSKTCVASSSNCIDATNLTLWKTTFSDPTSKYDYANSGSVNMCPDSGTRCQDGSCRLSGGSGCITGTCPFIPNICTQQQSSLTAKISVYCPSHLPFLCPSGQCATSPDKCESSNACPFHLPIRCTATTANFGLCVAQTADCGDTQFIDQACPAGKLPCPSVDISSVVPFCVTCSTPDANGFCSDSSACPTNSTGCPRNFYMCHDKQCVDGINTFCTNAANDYVNACPINRPYRCEDGWCAISRSYCPLFPSDKSCGTSAPVLCADGICRASSDQCPTIRPCLYTAGGSAGANGPMSDGSTRCPDGSCGVPIWSLSGVSQTFTCPVTSPCNTSALSPRPYRCRNGLCAANSSMCIVDTPASNSGCPASWYKCSNGQCVDSSSSCPPVFVSNGCSLSQPYKCRNGACAIDSASCPAPCTGNSSYLCGDGTCAANEATCGTSVTCVAGTIRCADGSCKPATQCLTASGCPANFPIRCASGHCSKYPSFAIPASTYLRGDFLNQWGYDPEMPMSVGSANNVNICPPRPVCGSAKPYLCANFECAESWSSCRAVMPCDVRTPVLCSDLTCSATQAQCGDSNYRCPISSPAMCPDGSCRLSIRECTFSIDAPYDKQNMNSVDSCAMKLSGSAPTFAPITCWDGSCATSYQDCIASRYAAAGISFNRDSVNSASPCNNTDALCADGHCAPFVGLCNVVPACPVAFPLRCGNGACTNDTCPQVSSCSSGGRNVDGTCTINPLPFNGCPLDLPYYCSGASLPCMLNQAQCVARFGQDATSLPNNFPAEGFTGQQACSINCQRDLSATAQTVTVSNVMGSGVFVDVSYDASYALRTRLFVPSGSLASDTYNNGDGRNARNSGHVRVRPVASALVQGLIKPFYSTVVSTPFICSSSLYEITGQGSLALNFTLHGSVDTQIYSGSSNGPISTQLQYPCDLQQTWQFLNIPDGAVQGSIAISQYQMVFKAGPSQGFPPYSNNNGAVDGSRTLIPWTVSVLGSSEYCLCSNITESSLASEVGKTLCIRAKPNFVFNYYSVNQETTPGSTYPVTGEPYWAKASSECPEVGVFNPLPGSQGGYGLSSGIMIGIPTNLLPVDPCEQQQAAVSSQIPFADICLAKFTSPAKLVVPLAPASGNIGLDSSTSGEWSCVENYNERQALPTWSSATGRPRNRVQGRISVCDDNTIYAFIYDKLLPPPPEVPPPKSAWEQWGKIVLAVTVPLLFLSLLAAFVIWRLSRYMKKYKQEKTSLKNYKEQAAHIDQFGGGLGIADEDDTLEMVANPLVIEMQELEREIKRVNENLSASAVTEEAEINQLEIERQRIFAEIQAVKAKLEEQQKVQPTAVEVAPVRNTGGRSGNTGGAGRTTQAAKTVDLGGTKGPKKKNF